MTMPPLPEEQDTDWIDWAAAVHEAATEVVDGRLAGVDAGNLSAVAISGSYIDLSDKPTIPAAYTDEQVRDVIGTAIVAGSGVTKTVNDAGDTITLAATGGVLVNAADHGLAAAATGAVNTAALTAAVAAIVTAGGGTLVVPPGVYDANLSITADVPILVLAWGATFRAYAASQKVVSVSQGVGINIEGCRIDGLSINGNGNSGVVGLDAYDTDGAFFVLPMVRSCATGVRFRVTDISANKWLERCGLADSYIYGCTTGIEFLNNGPGPHASFNEVVLRNVGVSNCTLGIAQRIGADFTRTTWDNVTVWINANQKGVLLDGRLDFARLTFGVESFSATGSVGVEVGANFSSYADEYSHHLDISFVGEFATQIVDNSPDAGIVFWDGRNVRYTKDAPAFLIQKTGEAAPRAIINGLGIDFGTGAAWPTGQLRFAASNRLNLNGRFAPTGGLVLKAPNGTEYVLSVGNDGALTTTAI